MLSDTVVSTIEYVKGTMDKKDVSEKVLVENAINKRLTSGALNNSGLTIEEFNIIKETLINIKEQQ
jgi:membrane-associated HD superfamily phosphohydrolase